MNPTEQDSDLVSLNEENTIQENLIKANLSPENPENIPEKALTENTVRPQETSLVNPEKDDFISYEESLVNFIPKQIDPEKQNQDQLKDNIFCNEPIQDDVVSEKESRENLQLEPAPSKSIQEITEDILVDGTLPEKLNLYPESILVKPIQKDISDQDSNDNVVNETLPEKVNRYNKVTEKQETVTEGDEKENVNPTN